MSEEAKKKEDTNKKPFYKKVWFWAIVVAVVICVGAAGANSPKDIDNNSNQDVVQDESNKSDKDNGAQSSEQVPTEYKNALKKAESYSKTMHMSKRGIYEQLTSEYGEKFPTEAAQYAIDNLKADYKANALAKAKSYQTTMSMSSSAIYDQLISEYGEKFTPDEAQYAVDHLND